MNDDMIDSFISESTTHINDINTAIIDLEQNPGDDEAMDSIFRSAHTLKGNAGAMGFNDMSNLAHAIEDVLDEIRDGNIDIDAEVIDDLFEGIDLFEDMMDEVKDNGDTDIDASDTIDNLRAYLDGGESASELPEITGEGVDELVTDADLPDTIDSSVYIVRSATVDDTGMSPVDALEDAFSVYEHRTHSDDSIIDVLISTDFGTENIEMAMDSVQSVDNVAICDVTEDVQIPGDSSETDGAGEGEDDGGDPFADMDPDDEDLDKIEINEVDGGGGGTFDFDDGELDGLDSYSSETPDESEGEDDDFDFDDDGDEDFDFDGDDDDDFDFDDDGDEDFDLEDEDDESEIQNEGSMKFADMKDDVEKESFEEVRKGMEEEGFDLTTDDSGEDVDVDSLLSDDGSSSVVDGDGEDPTHKNIELDIDFDGDDDVALDDTAEDDSMDTISEDFGDMLDTKQPNEDDEVVDDNGEVVFNGPGSNSDESLPSADLNDLFSGGSSNDSADDGPDLSHDTSDSETGLPEFEEILREEEGEIEFEGDDEDLGIQSIKVDVGELDDLSSYVQELVTTRLRLKEVVDSLDGSEVGNSAAVDIAQERASELDKITSQIQDSVMNIRLVPLEHATQRLPRIARDVARENDKKVDFDVEGDDVELDRTILSRLGDPLMHLIRNAVDHGVEPPEEREEKGKPKTGSVRVRADRSKDHVVVTVEDDGGGINADAVREKSVEKGLFTEEQAEKMSDQQAYELILRPGFSTRDEVTETSGRGVGMDVVYTMVQSVDGSIDVYSEDGVGTRVELNLPVSLAIDEVMFIEVAGETFGVPVKNIDDITTTDELTSVDKEPVIMNGGDSYPLVRLQERFNIVPESESMDIDRLMEDEEKRLIRIDGSIRQVTLECDRIIESEEVVVEPYDGVLSRIPGLSGAAVLAEGNVVNILDVNSL